MGKKIKRKDAIPFSVTLTRFCTGDLQEETSGITCKQKDEQLFDKGRGYQEGVVFLLAKVKAGIEYGCCLSDYLNEDLGSKTSLCKEHSFHKTNTL